MKSLILVLMAFWTLSVFGEIVEFKLQTDNKSCLQSSAQVVISQDKLPLYQMAIPVSGAGQAHLLTGNYQVDIRNKEGCTYQNIIQISELPNQPFEIKLTPTTQLVASAATVTTPCVWANFGCSGNSYPFSGRISMNQLKYFFSGKEEGKFKLKFKSENFNVLTSVPLLKEKEVTGELRKGSLYVENTWYPSLSYQVRISDEYFQSHQGFCGNRKEIFQFMLEGLKKYEFPNEARIDFAENWSHKIPEALKYCVYPQVNAQLDKISPIEMTFDDKAEVRTERLFYLVVPFDFNGRRISVKETRFSDKPKSVWTHYTRTVIPKTAYIYEWGLGFIYE